MRFDFLNDLDGYFCEKYANYDKICSLTGYSMPKMQTTKRLADGRDYSYTLPASTMRLAGQEKKDELLVQLKEKISEAGFSFSFRPLSFWERLKKRNKKDAFRKVLPVVLARKNASVESVFSDLAIERKTWDRILRGAYYPTKNLLYTIAFAAHLSLDDLAELMKVCGFTFDLTLVKDVVVSYLVSRGVYNSEMVKAAFEEYKIEGLFLKD